MHSSLAINPSTDVDVSSTGRGGRGVLHQNRALLSLALCLKARSRARGHRWGRFPRSPIASPVSRTGTVAADAATAKFNVAYSLAHGGAQFLQLFFFVFFFVRVSRFAWQGRCTSTSGGWFSRRCLMLVIWVIAVRRWFNKLRLRGEREFGGVRGVRVPRRRSVGQFGACVRSAWSGFRGFFGGLVALLRSA